MDACWRATSAAVFRRHLGQRFDAAVIQPVGRGCGALQKIQQDGFVVAHQEMTGNAVHNRSAQPFDHRAAVVAPVDIVAEKDDGDL